MNDHDLSILSPNLGRSSFFRTLGKSTIWQAPPDEEADLFREYSEKPRVQQLPNETNEGARPLEESSGDLADGTMGKWGKSFKVFIGRSMAI